MTNVIGWCIFSAMGVALVCGAGKVFVDWSKASPGRYRRKMPWELD